MALEARRQGLHYFFPALASLIWGTLAVPILGRGGLHHPTWLCPSVFCLFPCMVETQGLAQGQSAHWGVYLQVPLFHCFSFSTRGAMGG